MARNLKLSLQNNKPAAINFSVEQHTSSKDFKNREYRIGSAISSKGKVSLKACRECCSDKGWYRQTIYIGDLIYILSNAEKYLEFEIEYALGQTRESAISQIKDTFRALEKMDSEAARRKLNDMLSINNPILHLLKYMNAIKEKLFETELCNLLSSEDFTHPKTMALVKRNLAITPPKPREKAQRKFEIETSDLKLNSSGEILYICRNCRALAYHPRESFSSSPIKVCRCKGASVPARHLVGYKTNKGVVVQITRTKAKVKTSTGIKELSTDDLIEAELSYLKEHKPESVKTFTSLMLWHHQTHNGCCHCVECCSQ